MHRRFLVNAVFGVALLFNQGGTLLIAALCPHVSGKASCETQLPDPDMSHEDRGHMGMVHETVSNPSPDEVALSQPIGPCSHCAVHSRPTQNIASVRGIEAPKRSADFNIPVQFSIATPKTVSPIAVVTSRAHGPPGELGPRYILINVFRI